MKRNLILLLCIQLAAVTPNAVGQSTTGSDDFGLGTGIGLGTGHDAAAYVDEGNILAAKGDLDGAIADYDKAIEVDPKYVSAYLNRAAAEKAKGDEKGAAADLKRSEVLSPKSLDADAKVAEGDLDGAIEEYNKAIAANPTNSNAYYDRADVKDREGDLDGAVADYTHAIEFNPSPNAYNCRALVKTEKGDTAGALADYNTAVEINQRFIVTYGNRGILEFVLRKWPEALADFRHYCEASDKKPDNRQSYFHLYMWIIRSRLGAMDAASKEISAYFNGRSAASQGDWISKVSGYLLGGITQADLLAAAASPDAKRQSGQLCEAWFYSGIKKLISGDKQTAADCFHKCLATERKDFTEYDLAKSELNALGK